MENISLTFLGTGNAIPTAKRNHTSILVNIAGECLLVDCGEGTQRQFRIASLSPAKIKRILLTHWHGDHILGLPGLFQTLAMTEYRHTLQLYGPKGTSSYLDKIMSLTPGLRISIQPHEVSSQFIDEERFSVEAASMHHGIATNAYAITLKDKRRLDKAKLKKLGIPHSPLLRELQLGKDIVFKGKKISAKKVSYLEKGKKVAFILDTAYNENAIKIASKADILVAEATFSSNEKARAAEYFHLTASEAATIAKKAKVKKLILTHISQRYEHDTSIIEKEAKKIFKNVQIVKDFDTITI